MKYKVGDWVKPNVGYVGQDLVTYPFEKEAYCIEKIIAGCIHLKGIALISFEEYELDPVCCLVKNDLIKVSDHDVACVGGYVRQYFYAYDPELSRPFLAVDTLGNITNWRYAISKKNKYRPYSNTSMAWLGKKIMSEDTKAIVAIIAVGKDIILTESNELIDMHSLFENWVWYNNVYNISVCGELNE